MNRQTHRKAYDRYLHTRWSSKQRDILFELTFEQWYNWWLSNGVDKNIDSTFDLCMCRNNDQGSYRLDNIYFATRSQNISDGHKFNPRNQLGNKNPNFGNKGAKNPLSKKIQTPRGVFDSLNEAAKAYNICGESMRKRTLRATTKEDYFYL